MGTFSWNKLSAFNQCPRKFELAYLENLELKPSKDNSPLMFGSAIHAGFEAALVAIFRSMQGGTSTDSEHWLDKAVAAARKNIADSTIQNKMFYNWDTREDQVDLAYYQMIEDITNRVPKFLRYYLPRIGLGSRFTPVSMAQVLPDLAEAHIPAIEIEFDLPIDDEDTINGRIDAVLWDNEEQELVLFDWKSRKAMPRDDMALIDGQLHLYASILNRHGANIRSVCMAQMRTGLPKPAELSKKDNMPLTGRASYDTTWEVWAGSLPAAVDVDYYRDEMKDKVKDFSAFWHPVFGYVTDTSSKITLSNTAMQIQNLNMVVDTGTLSGVYSYQTCERCPFQRLCANAFRYGGDVTEIIERDYQPRKSEVVTEVETVDE